MGGGRLDTEFVLNGRMVEKRIFMWTVESWINLRNRGRRSQHWNDMLIGDPVHRLVSVLPCGPRAKKGQRRTNHLISRSVRRHKRSGGSRVDEARVR